MTTKRHRGWLVIAIGLAVLAGCSAHAQTEAHADQPTTSTASAPPRHISYSLYTHCGIAWAQIDRGWWKAERPLSDGNGNPPARWGNPFQPGALTFIDVSTARFDSSAGSVMFHRTERDEAPFNCA